MLEFKGTFSYNFMTEFGEKFERLYQETLSTKVYRASFFILNELLQNVSLYSSEKEIVDSNEYGVGSIWVDVLDERVYFITQNRISDKSLVNVKSKLEYYNSLSLEELKQLSKEKRKMEQEEESKGGGIGLIEIRKRAKSQINFEITESKGFKEIKIFVNVYEGEING